MVKVKMLSKGGRWYEGTVEREGKVYEFQAKVYRGGSEYGIDGGQVSKLHVKSKETGEEVVSYDRGWDKKAEEEGERKVIEGLIARLEKIE